ncbi:MAG TPA: AraC family transcriptional regulator [Thermoanaerobaculaceae bacterium]|nr:AraC family transcriptional regulator [Thermoanaerobaculaceae bacterium]HRS15366.1 AraC family transcriptional regulator [Thermoanaerobaculaceae bacterium]
MDALSDVLSTLRLHTTLYCRSELTAPWGLAFPAGPAAGFHAVRRGTCWLRMAGLERPVALAAGDMVLFPHGAAHELADAPDRPAEDLFAVLARRKAAPGTPLAYGGSGAPVTLLCGSFGFERAGLHPLLEALPPRILLRGEDGRASGWLEPVLEILARESGQERPGSQAVIARATDMLFVQVVRSVLEQSEGCCQGWLAGLRHPGLARALALMHRQPEQPLTLEWLAAAAGMSRSAFCALFAERVGETPHRYLTRWRMHRAAALLRDTALALPELAGRVGFGDETSFSRTFKRHLGVPPATYRRSHQRAA